MCVEIKFVRSDSSDYKPVFNTSKTPIREIHYRIIERYIIPEKDLKEKTVDSLRNS
jgi:hypothetical protein